MSIVTGQLLQNKISAGSVGQFGQGLRTFVPQFQVCPARYAYDQYGRTAPPDSIDTETCPGGFPAELRISVENSLRPFISPNYFNLPIVISGGTDTLFGHVNTNRKSAFGFQDMIPIDMNKDPLQAQGVIGSRYLGNTNLNPVYENPKEEFRFYRRS